MVKLALNKSALKKERDNLALYERILPSLDLKRMQLTAEWKKEQASLAKDIEREEQIEIGSSNQLPMPAYKMIQLSGLVKVKDVQIEEENVVGVRLPALREVIFEITDYSMLAKPHWVDVLVERLKELSQQRLQIRVAKQRVMLLDKAVKRITQRVNLFEKILIPNSKKNIQRIRIFLGDAETSAIVRSKIAKVINQSKREKSMSEGIE